MSKAKFDKAVEIIGSLPKNGPINPSQDDQLYFYKYYKQATIGDCTGSRPGMFDFVAKKKWDAWAEVKGTSAEEAHTKYVDKFLEILKGIDDESARKHIEAIEAA